MSSGDQSREQAWEIQLAYHRDAGTEPPTTVSAEDEATFRMLAEPPAGSGEERPRHETVTRSAIHLAQARMAMANGAPVRLGDSPDFYVVQDVREIGDGKIEMDVRPFVGSTIEERERAELERLLPELPGAIDRCRWSRNEDAGLLARAAELLAAERERLAERVAELESERAARTPANVSEALAKVDKLHQTHKRQGEDMREGATKLFSMGAASAYEESASLVRRSLACDAAKKGGAS